MKKSLFRIALFILSLGLLAWGTPVQADTITVGNDAIERPYDDNFDNFCVIDTNNPVSATGWLTVFKYYAVTKGSFRFLLVDGSNRVRWISAEITPAAIGGNGYTPDSPVPVEAGWNLGVYFADAGAIPFSTTGAPASYTPDNSGLPVLGQTLIYQGISNRTYSFGATGDTEAAPPPQAVNVTVVKYLDGQPASETSANNNYFLMTDYWDDPNVGVGAGRFSLGAWGVNTDNPYQAVSNTLTAGAIYWTGENTDQYAVGTTCDNGRAFRLDGYTVGDTLAQAAAATPGLTEPNLTLAGSKYVVVWNSTCPQTETIVAGNDTYGPESRPIVDIYGDFVVVDTNHPVSADGWLTRFYYYAVNPYPFRFILVDGSDVVQWVGDEITPAATGVNAFAPPSPIPAQKGWNVGLYFAYTGASINGTVPYEYTGAPAYYRSNLSGSPLPVIGKTLDYESSSNRIYSFAATGVTTVPPPETVRVTVVKYLDGIRADAVSADNAEFPMRALTGDVEEIFVLGPVGVNSLNAYEARTPDMAPGVSYSAWEDTSQGTVGASCDTGQPYRLVGYTTGDTLAQAVNTIPTTAVPSLNDIAGDKFIIVWNETCGTDYDCECTDNGHHYGNDMPDNHQIPRVKCKPRDNGHHYGNDMPDNHQIPRVKCKPRDNGHHYGNDKPDNHESPNNNSQGKKK